MKTCVCSNPWRVSSRGDEGARAAHVLRAARLLGRTARVYEEQAARCAGGGAPGHGAGRGAVARPRDQGPGPPARGLWRLWWRGRQVGTGAVEQDAGAAAGEHRADRQAGQRDQGAVRLDAEPSAAQPRGGAWSGRARDHACVHSHIHHYARHQVEAARANAASHVVSSVAGADRGGGVSVWRVPGLRRGRSDAGRSGSAGETARVVQGAGARHHDRGALVSLRRQQE
jgi:hypothetical protein